MVLERQGEEARLEAAGGETPYRLYLLIDEYDNFANEAASPETWRKAPRPTSAATSAKRIAVPAAGDSTDGDPEPADGPGSGAWQAGAVTARSARRTRRSIGSSTSSIIPRRLLRRVIPDGCLRCGQDHWLIYPAEVPIERQDRTIFSDSQRVGETGTEVQRVLQTRPGRDPRLLEVGSYEADPTLEEIFFELVRELRLPVAQANQCFCEVDRAHPQVDGVGVELFTSRCSRITPKASAIVDRVRRLVGEPCPEPDAGSASISAEARSNAGAHRRRGLARPLPTAAADGKKRRDERRYPVAATPRAGVSGRCMAESYPLDRQASRRHARHRRDCDLRAPRSGTLARPQWRRAAKTYSIAKLWSATGSCSKMIVALSRVPGKVAMLSPTQTSQTPPAAGPPT